MHVCSQLDNEKLHKHQNWQKGCPCHGWPCTAVPRSKDHMSRSPEEWMPWPKISYTFWIGQTSNLYTDGARRPTLTFVMTSKLKTASLLKSPLAGGGGILWQPHCRLHSLLCIVYVCVHIDRAVQKWVGKKYHHKTRLRQCQGEHRIVILAEDVWHI